ncbi:MAG: cupin domain-containing protein [Caldilineales bacterium]
MIHLSIEDKTAKGWLAGPWNSDLPVPVGWATQGIAKRHVHHHMYEIYLVARGTSTAIVNGQETHLQSGDVLVIEPNEVHTFSRSSANYLHFVIQAPFVAGDKELQD